MNNQFEYDYYKKIINVLIKNKYRFSSYLDADDNKKNVILRHDVDLSLDHALLFAELEHELGVSSTYFILLTSDFYNPMSKINREIIKKIIDYGHKVYLHFDTQIYNYDSTEELTKLVNKEIKALSEITGDRNKIVSFHRPIKELFNLGLEDGIISAYDKRFFSDFNYISDSRMCWKKDPIKEINCCDGNIQLLTHPFWYREKELNKSKLINELIKQNENVIVNSLNNNISNFNGFFTEEKNNEK
ncbi:MAG: hypothetical protein RSC93_05080 [Erysipelotrichaceae bacterium]